VLAGEGLARVAELAAPARAGVSPYGPLGAPDANGLTDNATPFWMVGGTGVEDALKVTAGDKVETQPKIEVKLVTKDNVADFLKA
jgi:hypothetical protein